MEEEPKPTQEQELPPEWKEKLREDIAAMPYYAMDMGERAPIDPSPVSITGGYDERSWPELRDKEKEFILNNLFDEIGFDPEDKPEAVRKYKSKRDRAQTEQGATPAWIGESEIRIYKTNFSEYGVWLHEISRPGSESPEYFLAGRGFEVDL